MLMFSLIILSLAAVAGAIGLVAAYSVIKDTKHEMGVQKLKCQHNEELLSNAESYRIHIDKLQSVIRDLKEEMAERAKRTEDRLERDAAGVRDISTELEKLRLFKKYTHDYLDQLGVPADPEPDAKHGCRMGSRFQWLLAHGVQTPWVQESASAEGQWKLASPTSVLLKYIGPKRFIRAVGLRPAAVQTLDDGVTLAEAMKAAIRTGVDLRHAGNMDHA